MGAESSKGSKSKESRSSSSSKGTKSQPKSSGNSAQASVLVFEAVDIELPQNQGSNLGHIDDQPDAEADPKHDCNIAKAVKPPLTFNELMSTPINFSAYVMNNLKIDNLTQEHLVGPTSNLLKGACRRQEYPFDLSKPLPLNEDQGRQVVPTDYFFNNDLEYLKAGGRPSTGVENYQKKLNITKPETFMSNITDIHCIQQSSRSHLSRKIKRNKLMCSDELYKFCDGTLTSVRTVLHDIAFQLEDGLLAKEKMV
nr:hypothetical protein [Tanacetum cinerariifolium]